MYRNKVSLCRMTIKAHRIIAHSFTGTTTYVTKSICSIFLQISYVKSIENQFILTLVCMSVNVHRLIRRAAVESLYRLLYPYGISLVNELCVEFAFVSSRESASSPTFSVLCSLSSNFLL